MSRVDTDGSSWNACLAFSSSPPPLLHIHDDAILAAISVKTSSAVVKSRSTLTAVNERGAANDAPRRDEQPQREASLLMTGVDPSSLLPLTLPSNDDSVRDDASTGGCGDGGTVRRAESSFELRNSVVASSPRRGSYGNAYAAHPYAHSQPSSPAYSRGPGSEADAGGGFAVSPTTSSYDAGSPRRGSFQYRRSTSWHRDQFPHDPLLGTRPSLSKLAGQQQAAPQRVTVHPRARSDSTEETLITPATTATSSTSPVTPRLGATSSTHLRTPYGSQGSLYMLAERHLERAEGAGSGEAGDDDDALETVDGDAAAASATAPRPASPSRTDSAKDSFHTGKEAPSTPAATIGSDHAASRPVTSSSQAHPRLSAVRSELLAGLGITGQDVDSLVDPIAPLGERTASRASQRSVHSLTTGPSHRRFHRRESQDGLESRDDALQAGTRLWAPSWSESPLSFFTPLPSTRPTFRQGEQAEPPDGHETKARAEMTHEDEQGQAATIAQRAATKKGDSKAKRPRQEPAVRLDPAATPQRSVNAGLRTAASSAAATSTLKRSDTVSFALSCTLPVLPLAACPTLFYVFEAAYLFGNVSPALVFAPILLFVATWISFAISRWRVHTTMVIPGDVETAKVAPSTPAVGDRRRDVARHEEQDADDEEEDPAIAALDDDSPKRRLALARLKEQLLRRTTSSTGSWVEGMPTTEQSDRDVQHHRGESSRTAVTRKTSRNDSGAGAQPPTPATLKSPPVPPPPPHSSPALETAARPSFGFSGRQLYSRPLRSDPDPTAVVEKPITTVGPDEAGSLAKQPSARLVACAFASQAVFLALAALSSAYCLAVSVWLLVERSGDRLAHDVYARGTLALATLSTACLLAVGAAGLTLLEQRRRDKARRRVPA